MSGHRWLTQRAWLLPIVVALVIGGHVVAARYALSHIALSATVVSSLVLLMIAKHLGAAVVVGPLVARWRRRAKRP